MRQPTKKLHAFATALSVVVTLFAAAPLISHPPLQSPRDTFAQHPDTDRFFDAASRYHQLDVVLVGYEADDTMLTTPRLAALADITKEASRIAGVAFATSLGNVPDMQSGDDGVVVRPIIDPLPDSPETLTALRATLQQRPHILGQLISRDFRAAVLVVQFVPDATEAAYARLKTLLDEKKIPGTTVTLFGYPAVTDYTRTAANSLTAAAVIATTLLLIGLTLATRRFSTVTTTLLLAAASGTAGLAANTLQHGTASALSALTFLPALALAATFTTRRHVSRIAALAAPAFVALVAAALATSSTPTTAQLGTATVATSAVFALLALMLCRPAEHPRHSVASSGRALIAITIAAALATFATTHAISHPERFDLAGSMRQSFSPSSPPGAAVAFFDTHFGGAETLTLRIRGNLENPATLHAIKRLADNLRAEPGFFTHVTSPHDLFELTSLAMTGVRTLPVTTGEARNLFFFLDSQNESRALIADHNDAIIVARIAQTHARNPDKAAGRMWDAVNKTFAIAASLDLRKLDDRARAYHRERIVTDVTTTLAAALRDRLPPNATTPTTAMLRDALNPLDPYISALSASPTAQSLAAASVLRDALTTSTATFFAPGEGPFDVSTAVQLDLVNAITTALGPNARESRGLARTLTDLLTPHAPDLDRDFAASVAGKLIYEARIVRRRVVANQLTAAIRTAARLNADTPLALYATEAIDTAAARFLDRYVTVEHNKEPTAERPSAIVYQPSGPFITDSINRTDATATLNALTPRLAIAALAALVLGLLGSVVGVATGASLATALRAFAVVALGLTSFATATAITGVGQPALFFAALLTVLAAALLAALADEHHATPLATFSARLILALPFAALAIFGTFSPVQRLMIQCAAGLFGIAVALTLTRTTPRPTRHKDTPHAANAPHPQRQ